MSLIGSLPSVTLLTSLLAGFRVRTFLYVVKAESGPDSLTPLQVPRLSGNLCPW